MVLIVFSSVVLRYGFNRPIGWTDELAKLFFTWIVFLGGALAVKRGCNISIDAVVQFMPPAARRVVAAIGDFLLLILFSVLIYYGILFSFMTAPVATPSLGVSVALVYAAAPVSAALMLIHHLEHIATTYFSPLPSRTRP
ncbi:MAG: TRAP transporter small permease [Hyphomicrobiales bacterium]|nr:TRAP transporter small permease [Hyphomicrobiales bacterium]